MQLPKHPYGKLTNDFVFKRIFGTESTKDILIMFLNHMIGSPRIVDVTVRNSEQLGMTSEDRKAVFDITCLTDRNEHFIVEMQHASQEFFREDSNNELMHDKHQYIFLELPRFKKGVDELENDYDRWVYLFRNMHKLPSRPVQFSGKEYDRLFELAKFSNFTPEELKEYMEAEKMFNDNQNCLNFAEKRGYLKGYDEGVEEGREAGRQEGREEGRALGISDAVNKMETAGMSVDQIALILELDAEEIRKML